MACTPIGVSPPHGVSSLSARHASAFSTSAFGNVIVASKCRTVPRSPDADPLAQLGHLGMEAAVVAEAERDAGLRASPRPPRRHRPCVSANGFSQKTCLPACAAAITCAACMRVRRRQHDRVDRRVGEQRLEAVGQRQLLRLGERRAPRATSCASRRRRSGSRRCRPAPTRPASGPTSPGRRWLL